MNYSVRWNLEIVFPCAIILDHIINFWDFISLTFDIGAADGWSVIFLKRWSVSLSVFYSGHLVLIIERYLQRSDQKYKIDSADIRVTHHFRICSWMFTLGCTEEKWLVNCGDFPGDSRSNHGIRLDFRFSEDKEVLFKVISNTFMTI